MRIQLRSGKGKGIDNTLKFQKLVPTATLVSELIRV